jgi:chromosome segregation ATPase
LVSALLSSFPDSAYKTTQFGELPLHLAVECGAAPEVVNLVIVANWSAIIAQDQSGRIPTEILDHMELLQLDEHRIVHESLTRCYTAYTRMLRVAQDEQSVIKRKHKAEFSSLARRHQQELKKELEKQDSLREEVRALESRIEDMKEVEHAKDHAIKKFNREKDMWFDQIKGLGEMIETLKQQINEEKNNVTSLMQTIREKDGEIRARDDKIETLSNDLRNVAIMHDDHVLATMIATEQSMRAMVSNQIALQKNITGQANGLKALLIARGISLPDEELSVESADHAEEMKSLNQEEILDEAEASNAVMAAAVAALQKGVPSQIKV